MPVAKETGKSQEALSRRHIEVLVKDFKVALPQLKAKQQHVLAELHKLNEQIQAAETVIQAFDGQLPEEPWQTTAKAKSRVMLKAKAPAPTPSGRAPNKQVYDHVGQVLAGGQEFRASHLRRELEKRFGIHYSFASVYRALTAGRDAGRYENRDGVWRERRNRRVTMT